jgi:hypothetical protein
MFKVFHLQIFRFDPDSVFPRLFPEDVTNIQFRQGKRHAVEGLYLSDNKRLPKAVLKERAGLHMSSLSCTAGGMPRSFTLSPVFITQ